MHDRICETCKKTLNNGDTVYQDRYFFRYHCSWDHLVEYMAEFFDVNKGKTIELSEDDY